MVRVVDVPWGRAAMAEKRTPSRKQPSLERFLKGAEAWMNAKALGKQWEPYWLHAPCCLLQYAREVNCKFAPAAEEMLKGLEEKPEAAHEKVAENLFGGYSQEREVHRQAALLMKGMIHGVRAAMRLVAPEPWRPGMDPPQCFVDSAKACFEAYNEAWPIGGTVVGEGAPLASRPFDADSNRVAHAL